MIANRFRHAAAQINWRRSLLQFRRFDHTVRLPWWMALPAYPAVFAGRAVVWAGSIPISMLRASAEWKRHQDQQPLAAEAAGPEVLVLRSFSGDGRLFAGTTALGPSGRPTETATLETMVAEAAETAGMRSVVGLYDKRSGAVPRGIRYEDVPHGDWQSNVRERIAAAEAIIVMATPGAPIRDGLQWELDELRRQGAHSRAVVVGPAINKGADRDQTYQVLETLGWPRPSSVPLVAYQGSNGRMSIHPSAGKGDRFLRDRYTESLATGLATVKGRRRDAPLA